MLDAICAEIHNYFTRESDKYVGNYAITDGVVTPPVNLQNGQFYRIIGSVFNDGVHKFGESDLTDEAEFHGAIWAMRVPKTFIDLVGEIKAWQDQYGGLDTKDGRVALSPFTSESFGGYSYSKSAGGGSADGSSVTTWQSTFASRLSVWRKLPGCE